MLTLVLETLCISLNHACPGHWFYLTTFSNNYYRHFHMHILWILLNRMTNRQKKLIYYYKGVKTFDWNVKNHQTKWMSAVNAKVLRSAMSSLSEMLPQLCWLRTFRNRFTAHCDEFHRLISNIWQTHVSHSFRIL